MAISALTPRNNVFFSAQQAIAAIILFCGLLIFVFSTAVPSLKVSALGVLAFLCFFKVQVRPCPPEKWRRAAQIGLPLLILSIFWWSLSFDSVQNSDFGIYFQCGKAAGKDTAVWVEACQSKFLHLNLIYWARSLFYTSFLAVTGAGYTELKLFNAVLHSVTLLVWFFALLRMYGIRTALVATVLLGVFPEYWFTTTLATTDNMVILFIVGFVFLLPRLAGQKTLVTVVGLAVVIFIANILRTIGPLMILGMILWAIGESHRHRSWHIVIPVTAVIVVYGLLGVGFGLFVPQGIADPLQLIKALSSVDFHSTQDFASNYPWGEYFWFSLPKSMRMEVALERVFREFVYGFEFLPIYVFEKIGILFSGTGYYGLSSFDFVGFNPDTLFTVPKSTILFNPEWFPYFSAVSFLYAGLALKSIVVGPLEDGRVISIAWIVAFCLLVLCLGETQGRYVVLIAPALSLLAAQAMVSDQHGPSMQQQTWQQTWPGVRQMIYGIGALFALYLMVSAIFTMVKKVHHFSTLNVTLNDSAAYSPTCRNAKITTSYKNVRVIMPPGVGCAALSLPLERDAKKISFFVSSVEFPYLWEPARSYDLAYEVMADQKTVYQAKLGSEPVRWQQVDLPVRGSEKMPAVHLVLMREATSSEAMYDVSWILP